jgi:hypothetical protein
MVRSCCVFEELRVPSKARHHFQARRLSPSQPTPSSISVCFRHGDPAAGAELASIIAQPTSSELPPKPHQTLCEPCRELPDRVYNPFQWSNGTTGITPSPGAASNIAVDRNRAFAMGSNLNSRHVDRCRQQSRDRQDQRHSSLPRAPGFQGKLMNAQK